jgi:DNA-damage-inducible protein J
MIKDDEIRFRENSEIKKKATAIIASMGLDLSSALRMFLRQVVKKRTIPFRLESGFSPEGERAILKAIEEHEEDRKTGKAKTYATAKELLDDLEGE